MKRTVAAFMLVSACALARPAPPYRVPVDLGPWVAALGSDDIEDSDEAAGNFVALGPAAVPVLATALRREPPAVRRGVVETLRRLELPEADRLLTQVATTDADEDVRGEALVALGKRDDPGSRPVVEAALADRHDGVRLAAARACATLCSSPQAAARLVDVAVRDGAFAKAAGARSSLAQMLADGSDRAGTTRAAIAARAGAAVTSDAPLDQRARAALLLAAIGDPAGAPVLAEAARDARDGRLRLYAIHALGQVGDARAVATLSDRLRDPEPSVALYAFDALGALAGRGVREADRARTGYTGQRPVGTLPPPGP